MSKIKVLILLSFGHLVTHWYIGVLMLVLPLLKQDFSLSFTAVGLIISLRSLAGAAGNTTSGIVVDFIGKPHILLTLSAAGLASVSVLIVVRAVGHFRRPPAPG